MREIALSWGGEMVAKMNKSKCLIIVLAIMTVTILTGCGTGEKLKDGNAAEIGPYVVGYTAPSEDASENEDHSLKTLFSENTSYTFDKTEYNRDGTGKATVTVTTPDIGDIIDQVIKEVYSENNIGKSEEELDEMMQTSFEDKFNGNFKTLSNTVDVELKKEDDVWKICPNDEFNKASTGNAEEVLIKYTQQYVLALSEMEASK